jgi:hypothetical protein
VVHQSELGVVVVVVMVVVAVVAEVVDKQQKKQVVPIHLYGISVGSKQKIEL